MAVALFQCSQITLVLVLAFFAGLTSTFTNTVIPLLQLRQVPPKAKTAEFCKLIEQGGRYLQPTSRILALALISMGYWSTQAAAPGTWKYYAASTCILVTLAPWEIVTIFPINDRIKEFDQRLNSGKLSSEEEEELGVLLNKWSVRHIGRWALPAVAAVVSASAIVQ